MKLLQSLKDEINILKYENALLKTKNSYLEREIKKLILENIILNNVSNALIEYKEYDSLIDFIVKTFFQDKIQLLEQFNEHLTLMELTDKYKYEIIKIFKSKIKKIFDIKKDNNTISNFIFKVIGKSHLAFYILYYGEYNDKYIEQIAYLNGRVEIKNGIFSFLDVDSFTFGNYESYREYRFTSFKSQNTTIYIQFKNDSIYVMIFRDEKQVRLILKIKNDFMNYPVLITEDHIETEDKIFENRENLDLIFGSERTAQKINIKELSVFQVEI
jgi:hypothetical protein